MRRLVSATLMASLAAVVVVTATVAVVFAADGGFDQYGYNNKARIFNGVADGVDRKLDGAVWGDPTYANDRLVMKWNAEWDRGKDEGWANGPYAAWENNEWNGKVPGGSGAVWHYKIIWVGSDLQSSPYWQPGGYPIWGQFEVIMDQGTDPNLGPGHLWFANAKPNGVGKAGK